MEKKEVMMYGVAVRDGVTPRGGHNPAFGHKALKVLRTREGNSKFREPETYLLGCIRALRRITA
jgi:hypothetical protein